MSATELAGGGRRVVRMFLKGNRDLMDALLPLQDAHHALITDKADPVDLNNPDRIHFQISHEPGARVDLIRQPARDMPVELLAQQCHGGTDWFAGQFNSRLFAESWDIVVLTLQPNVTDDLWCHQEQGYLFTPPHGWECDWNARQIQWFQSHFSPMGGLQVREFTAHFECLVHSIRTRLNAPVLVLNCSSFDPQDWTSRYGGIAEEPRSVRAQRFNLELMEVSARTGLSIIDIDRIVGELGAKNHVVEFLRYSDDTSSAVRHECLRVMQDLGLFEKSRRTVSENARGTDPEIRRLTMPFVSRVSGVGVVVKWHKAPGDFVNYGDDLLDINMQFTGWRIRSRNERIHHLTDSRSQGSGAAMEDSEAGAGLVIPVRVTAVDTGFLRRVDAAPGTEIVVGQSLAVLATNEEETLYETNDTESGAGAFRVVVNLGT